MTEQQIKSIFPKASESVIRLNRDNQGFACGSNGVHELFERQQREQAARVRAVLEKVRDEEKQAKIAKNGRRTVEIGGQKNSFRSTWESNYARYLEFLKVQGHIAAWEYEPQVFYFDSIRRGTTNYTPDFKVIYLDGHHEWREVKGWMDPKSKTKIKRFRKFFPKEILRVIDSSWFKANGANLAAIVPGWERKK